jgi:anti-sigma factor RsiW
MSGGIINEDDLQAYVDGHLDPSRSVLVERYLEQNPATGALIAAYIEQSRDLRAAFASITATPALVPISEPGSDIDRRAGRPSLWIAAAAALLQRIMGRLRCLCTRIRAATASPYYLADATGSKADRDRADHCRWHPWIRIDLRRLGLFRSGDRYRR